MKAEEIGRLIIERDEYALNCNMYHDMLIVRTRELQQKQSDIDELVNFLKIAVFYLGDGTIADKANELIQKHTKK